MVQKISRFLYYGGDKIQVESPVACDFLKKSMDVISAIKLPLFSGFCHGVSMTIQR